ncbi:hypothetical protein SAMN04489841_1668 [Natrinema salaciae]|uniref:Uncharacterized protein n=2 Tax=Natrinema salaciae TaxID=1186196 RepID=A0A1H9FST8_9EURY|nr:hypothetical protein SAMN04489841_1668 [Natrinema salaciae]
MKEKGKRRSLNRRNVLRSASLAGLSIVGLSGGATAIEKNRTVEKIEGHKKRNILFDVIFSEEAQRLQDNIDEPIYPELETGSVFQVSESNKTDAGKNQYRVVTVNYSRLKKNRHSENSSSIFLTWNNKESNSAPGCVLTILDDTAKTQTRLFENNGKVTESALSIGDADGNTREISSKSDISTQDSLDGENCVEYISEECNNVNWSCVASIGLAYGGCGLAVISGGWAGVILCLAEGGVWIWQVADEENCNLCDSSELVEHEVCGPDSSYGPGSP